MNDRKITDIASVIDSLHSTPEYSHEGFPMVRVIDVNNEFIKLEKCFKVEESTFQKHNKNHAPQKGDIIITRVGSFGLLGYVDSDKKFCLGQNIAIIHPKINSKFLYYYLLSPYIQSIIHGNIGGSAYKSISLADIRNLPYNDINLDVDKIGNLLYSLDSKIELNNRTNAELESMAKTLYDYWFVQFEFTDKNGKPYKTSGGKMVWNEELKREIPEGWEVKLFSDWINNDKSGDWGKEQIEGNYTEKVYCIRGADINGLNGLGELKSPERYILEKNLHKTLDPADLIVEISGGSPTQSTGRLAFITEETLARFDAPIICSNFCKAVTLKNKKQLFNFVYHWKSIYDAGVLFGYEGKTSGIKNLLFESFISSHYTVVPEMSATNKFYDFMKQLESKKQKNLKENQKLTELRDWLLPMLMNGQVKVN